jgi:hypothetical protein
MIAELLILAATFGSAPTPPAIEVTPVGLPPGVEIEVAFPAAQEPWPAGWICAEEPATQAGTIAWACADEEQILHDYPPPYYTPDGDEVVQPLRETAG